MFGENSTRKEKLIRFVIYVIVGFAAAFLYKYMRR